MSAGEIPADKKISALRGEGFLGGRYLLTAQKIESISLRHFSEDCVGPSGAGEKRRFGEALACPDLHRNQFSTRRPGIL